MNKKILYKYMADLGWGYNRKKYACTFIEVGYITFDYKHAFSCLRTLEHQYISNEWSWLEDS